MSQSTKSQLNKKAEDTNATIYRSLVGKLLYLTNLRPTLVYAMNLLSRFMTKPTKIQFGATKQVLRYLARTSDYGIQYNKGVKCVLESFVDSDQSGDVQDKKITSWFVFNLGLGGVCWA